MQDRLTRRVGPPVEGDDFFDREAETALFIQHLNEGAHLLVVAMRRIGNTSLMKKVARQLGDDYYEVRRETADEA